MYKRLALASLLVVLLLLIPGCSLIWPQDSPTDLISGDDDDTNPVSGSFLPTVMPTSGSNQTLRTVFLLDGQGRYLVPYVLGVDNAEGVARAVLNRLVDTTENAAALTGTGLQLPLPTKTAILGLTVRDGLAIVDFTEDFLEFRDANHERLAIDAVLYTLTEFNTIDQVELRVAGKPIGQLPSGQPLASTISREDRDLNLEVSSAVTDIALSSKVRLYFSCVSEGGGLIYFVPVTRVVPTTTDSLTAAVLELIKGPLAGSGLSADVPQSAELRSVQLRGDTVIADFSSGLTGYSGGSAAEQAMIGALLFTLSDSAAVENVRITINGQIPSLPEGMDLSQPVARPMFVNPFVI